MDQPVPKSRSMTLFDSFNSPLPALPKKEGLGRTHISSDTVLKTAAPKFWIDRTIQPYEWLADEALSTRAVKLDTVEHCLPTLEYTFKVSAEADVVRAAALYFIHPCNVALQAKHSDVEILCLAEFPSPGMRPDIIYRKGGRTFAILEYKVIDAVNGEEFVEARVEWGLSPREISGIKREVQQAGKKSLFEGNSLKQIKQMACYSNRSREKTKYIAMFNWDWLFLSVFSSDKAIVDGTLVDRDGPEKNKVRKAFLGWLLEAYDNNGQRPNF